MKRFCVIEEGHRVDIRLELEQEELEILDRWCQETQPFRELVAQAGTAPLRYDGPDLNVCSILALLIVTYFRRSIENEEVQP